MVARALISPGEGVLKVRVARENSPTIDERWGVSPSLYQLLSVWEFNSMTNEAGAIKALGRHRQRR
jgi:hypothetical protein